MRSTLRISFFCLLPALWIVTAICAENTYSTRKTTYRHTSSIPQQSYFADAEVVTGIQGQRSVDNTYAVTESGEPDHAGNGGPYHSLWWKYISFNSGGLLEFSSIANDIDTVIAVYTGDVINALVTLPEYGHTSVLPEALKSAPEARSAVQSFTRKVKISQDIFYSIAMDGYGIADTGTVYVTWKLIPAPENDDFAYAQEISGLNGITAGTTSNATYEINEPPHAQMFFPNHSVWWQWTAPLDGALTVRTENSAFDTVLAVYTGSAVDSLTEIASNDNTDEGVSWSEITAAVDAGTTYYFVVDGHSEQEYGDVSLEWELTSSLPPPSNDNFNNAIVITGDTGVVSAYTTNATVEAGEPEHSEYWEHYHSVWWQWTAPANGALHLSTDGSTFDTLLGVYTGKYLTTLVEIVSDDDEGNGDGTWSEIYTNAIAGVTYYFVVGSSFEFDYGTAFLQWDFTKITGAPTNDNFADATVISGLSGTDTSYTTDATSENNEPAHFEDGGAFHSVWWKWTAPTNGLLTIDTYGSEFDTVMAMYTGNTLDSLQRIVWNDEEPYGDVWSEITTNVMAGTTYYFAVDGYDETEYGTVSLHWNVTPLAIPPVNDDFVDAAVITGNTGSDTGTTTDAGVENGEPPHAHNGGPYHSVWWEWIAPTNGVLTLRTEGSSFDTVLGIYTGTHVNNLTGRAANNNKSSSVTWSEITVDVTKGTKYYIAVDGNDAMAYGDVMVQWDVVSEVTPPVNDDFIDATVITGFSGSSSSYITEATYEGGECPHAHNGGPFHSVWWCWTAPTNGILTVTTQGSTCDTVLGMYTGTRVDNVTEYAANDNVDNTVLWSEITVDVTKGTRYYFAVDGAQYNEEGEVTLSWEVMPLDTPRVESFLINNGAFVVNGSTVVLHNVCTENPTHYIASEDASFSGATWQPYSPSPQFILSPGIGRKDVFFKVRNEMGESRRARDYIYKQNIAPPSNDDFINAQIMTGDIGVDYVRNLYATSEQYEPAHAGRGPYHSLWWKWTAPHNGTVDVMNIMSDIHTVLGMYTGATLDVLEPLAASDGLENPARPWSEIKAYVSEGVTYYFAVDSYTSNETGYIWHMWEFTPVLSPELLSFEINNGATHVTGAVVDIDFICSGTPTHYRVSEMNTFDDADWQTYTSSSTFTLSDGVGMKTLYAQVKNENGLSEVLSDDIYRVAINRPDNDNFRDAYIMQGGIGNDSESNEHATKEDNEPAHAGNNGPYHSIWWRWTAPSNGSLPISTEGSDFDTVLAVYTGAEVDSLTEIASNDNWYEHDWSVVNIPVDKDTTYYIAVDSVSVYEYGNTYISWSFIEAPPPEIRSFTINNDAVVTTSRFVTLTSQCSGAPTEYMASELSTFSDAVWLPYNESVAFTLSPSEGNKRVYMKVRNERGGESVPVYDSIVYDKYEPPYNDDFTNAHILTGVTGNTDGSTEDATYEIDEPQHAGNGGPYHSAWWRWTAPANGTFMLSTQNSLFDTVLGMYTGTSVATLTEIAANDNVASFPQTWSRVTAEVNEGETYYFAVDGSIQSMYGGVQLAWEFTPEPPPDILAMTINNDDTRTTNRNVLVQTTCTGDPIEYIASESADFSDAEWREYSEEYLFTLSNGDGVKTVYMKVRSERGGESTVVSDSIMYEIITPPANDDFADALVCTGLVGSSTCNTKYATTEDGEPDHGDVGGPYKSVWWQWTAMSNGILSLSTEGSHFDTILAVYTGDTVRTLVHIADNDDEENEYEDWSYIETNIYAGVTYYIAVDGWDESGECVLQWSCVYDAPYAPEVEEFSINNDAAVVTNNVVTLNNVCSDEPTEYCASESSDFSDAQWHSYSSSPLFTLSAGDGTKTVYFKVRNAAGESAVAEDDIYLVQLNSPVNDDFTNATQLSGSDGIVYGSNTDATPEDGEPEHAENGGPFFSVWWKWTAPQNGTILINTKGSNFDTVLGMYTGDAVSSLTEIASNDDEEQDYEEWSEIITNVYYGQEYYFAVDSLYDDESGNITLTWQFTPDNAAVPVITSFTINDNAAFTTNTTVVVKSTCLYEPTSFMVSEEPTFAGQTWHTYTSVVNVVLSPIEGEKTLYFKVKNAYGESDVVSDTILLSSPPEISYFAINNNASATTSRNVRLNNEATHIATHYMASENMFFSNASWKAYSSSPSFYITSPGEGDKQIYFKVRNALGESSVVYDDITLVKEDIPDTDDGFFMRIMEPEVTVGDIFHIRLYSKLNLPWDYLCQHIKRSTISQADFSFLDAVPGSIVPSNYFAHEIGSDLQDIKTYANENPLNDVNDGVLAYITCQAESAGRANVNYIALAGGINFMYETCALKNSNDVLGTENNHLDGMENLGFAIQPNEAGIVLSLVPEYTYYVTNEIVHLSIELQNPLTTEYTDVSVLLEYDPQKLAFQDITPGILMPDYYTVSVAPHDNSNQLAIVTSWNERMMDAGRIITLEFITCGEGRTHLVPLPPDEQLPSPDYGTTVIKNWVDVMDSPNTWIHDMPASVTIDISDHKKMSFVTQADSAYIFDTEEVAVDITCVAPHGAYAQSIGAAVTYPPDKLRFVEFNTDDSFIENVYWEQEDGCISFTAEIINPEESVHENTPFELIFEGVNAGNATIGYQFKEPPNTYAAGSTFALWRNIDVLGDENNHSDGVAGCNVLVVDSEESMHTILAIEGNDVVPNGAQYTAYIVGYTNAYDNPDVMGIELAWEADVMRFDKCEITAPNASFEYELIEDDIDGSLHLFSDTISIADCVGTVAVVRFTVIDEWDTELILVPPDESSYLGTYIKNSAGDDILGTQYEIDDGIINKELIVTDTEAFFLSFANAPAVIDPGNVFSFDIILTNYADIFTYTNISILCETDMEDVHIVGISNAYLGGAVCVATTNYDDYFAMEYSLPEPTNAVGVVATVYAVSYTDYDLDFAFDFGDELGSFPGTYVMNGPVDVLGSPGYDEDGVSDDLEIENSGVPYGAQITLHVPETVDQGSTFNGFVVISNHTAVKVTAINVIMEVEKDCFEVEQILPGNSGGKIDVNSIDHLNGIIQYRETFDEPTAVSGVLCTLKLFARGAFSYGSIESVSPSGEYEVDGTYARNGWTDMLGWSDDEDDGGADLDVDIDIIPNDSPILLLDDYYDYEIDAHGEMVYGDLGEDYLENKNIATDPLIWSIEHVSGTPVEYACIIPVPPYPMLIYPQTDAEGMHIFKVTVHDYLKPHSYSYDYVGILIHPDEEWEYPRATDTITTITPEYTYKSKTGTCSFDDGHFIITGGSPSDVLRIHSYANIDTITSDSGLKRLTLVGSLNALNAKGPVGTIKIKNGNLGDVNAQSIKNIMITAPRHYIKDEDAFDDVVDEPQGLVGHVKCTYGIGSIIVKSGDAGALDESEDFGQTIRTSNGDIKKIIAKGKKRRYFEKGWGYESYYGGGNIFAHILAPKGSIRTVSAQNYLGWDNIDNPAIISAQNGIKKIQMKWAHVRNGDEPSFLANVFTQGDIKQIKVKGGYFGTDDLQTTIHAKSIKNVRCKLWRDYYIDDGDPWVDTYGGDLYMNILSDEAINSVKGAGDECISRIIAGGDIRSIAYNDYKDEEGDSWGGDVYESAFCAGLKMDGHRSQGSIKKIHSGYDLFDTIILAGCVYADNDAGYQGHVKKIHVKGTFETTFVGSYALPKVRTKEGAFDIQYYINGSNY